MDLNSKKLTELSGGTIKIKREHNCFISFDYEQIIFPESILSIITSAAKNCVSGFAINKNKELLSFQAITIECNNL